MIDLESVQKGKLAEDFDLFGEKMIQDPLSIKPQDWVDESEIIDPESKKPSNFEPASIPDPLATEPAGWDSEIDGTSLVDIRLNCNRRMDCC